MSRANAFSSKEASPISGSTLKTETGAARVVVDLEPDADPPKVLAIGPDPAGDLLEVIWVDRVDTELVIHAMDLRPKFYDLLPTGEDPTS